MEKIENTGLPLHKLQRVLAMIDLRLAETMHVRHLADGVGLSPFHFARMFKKSTGHSPHAYITLRRMELAKALLADAKLSLLEVGARAGYQTQAHFTDVFRKHVGMTPGRYRRQCMDEQIATLAAPLQEIPESIEMPASPVSPLPRPGTAPIAR